MVLRMPTSFARCSLRAVDRFIKLIQASSRTKAPMIPKNQTKRIRPPSGTPKLKSPWRCIRSSG